MRKLTSVDLISPIVLSWSNASNNVINARMSFFSVPISMFGFTFRPYFSSTSSSLCIISTIFSMLFSVSTFSLILSCKFLSFLFIRNLFSAKVLLLIELRHTKIPKCFWRKSTKILLFLFLHQFNDVLKRSKTIKLTKNQNGTTKVGFSHYLYNKWTFNKKAKNTV